MIDETEQGAHAAALAAAEAELRALAAALADLLALAAEAAGAHDEAARLRAMARRRVPGVTAARARALALRARQTL
jgi:hypothetical protein